MANNLNGKLKMNNISECFNIGSVVTCRTCYQKDIEGEVLAFDAHTKILILKCTASNGRPSVCDINFVNLNYVSDVQVIKEVTAAPPVPHSLSINMLKNRLKNNVDGKRRLITSLQAGASPEGQKLFLTMSKTIPEVCWDGQDIIVYDNVKISPPYKADNVSGIGIGSSKGVAHIRKVVEKYLEDAQSAKKDLQTSNNNNNNNKNNSISVSSTSSNSGNLNCAAPLPQ